MGCPVSVSLDDDSPYYEGKTLNISDGGMLLSVPVDSVPSIDHKVHMRVAVPRTTPNTRMLEDFQLDAVVVRHHPMTDNSMAAVAFRFAESADMNLEV